VLTRLGVIALWLRMIYGLPYVITEHWSRYMPEVNTYHGALRKVITRLVVKYACAVTAPAENLKRAMQSHGLKNRHFIILPNVVDTDRFVPAVINTTQANRHMVRKIRFIHVSCFEDQSKNITGTLNVLKMLSLERQDWECLMAGDGADRERIMRLAAELGLDNMVCFTGLLEGGALIEAIHSSAFMIQFSWYETFSVVIREAFACGLPVVATAVGGIPEALSKERGLLVKPGDEKGMLEAVEWMLNHYIDYDREKIRAYAVANFGKEMVRKKLEELYQMVREDL
jgi:glycosyltransferase involved in cell wall biosynthesis